MSEGMTLEQVRDAIALKLERGRDASRASLKEWHEALSSHITQPAQAVDVGADVSAIEGVAMWLLHRFGPDTPEAGEASVLLNVAKRSRALSGEKAGRVDDWKDEHRAYLAYRLNRMAEGGPLAFCADTLRDAASWLASSTPDKKP